jgi:hypothetical protein
MDTSVCVLRIEKEIGSAWLFETVGWPSKIMASRTLSRIALLPRGTELGVTA